MGNSLLSSVALILTTAASLATVGGVLFGVIVYRRQMKAQVFLAYTARYEAIMSSYPAEARVARLDAAHALPPSTPELSLCILSTAEKIAHFRRSEVAHSGSGREPCLR
jgi:hypothetical protein